MKGKYQHYSGKFYEVLGEAIHTETKERMIVYKPLYDIPEGDVFFVRPKEMFFETIMVDGKKIPRFTKIDQ